MPKSKQHIVAKAHENPKYAAMSGRELSKAIGVCQPAISKWRKANFNKPVVKVTIEKTRPTRRLPAKVTVASVKRKWEEKYAALNKQYEWLADRHVEMARAADAHRNNEKNLLNEIIDLKTKIGKLENKSWLFRLFNLKG